MTDSAADIPERIKEKYDLAFVPTVIRFEDDVYYEGVDLTLEEFYKILEKGEKHPSTANPTLHHDYELYEELGKEADHIINVVISSGISGSLNTATKAKQLYEKRVKNPATIHLHDSWCASYGIGIQALHAANLVKAGKGVEEILESLQKHRKNISVGFTVDDLKFLERGGRLSKGKYVLANLIGMKPIIEMIDGKMMAEKKVRHHDVAVKETFESAYERLGKPDKFNAYIHHGRNLGSAKMLKEYIEKNYGDKEINIGIIEIGMTIVSHTGPGTIGVVLDSYYDYIL